MPCINLILPLSTEATFTIQSKRRFQSINNSFSVTSFSGQLNTTKISEISTRLPSKETGQSMYEATTHGNGKIQSSTTGVEIPEQPFVHVSAVTTTSAADKTINETFRTYYTYFQANKQTDENTEHEITISSQTSSKSEMASDLRSSMSTFTEGIPEKEQKTEISSSVTHFNETTTKLIEESTEIYDIGFTDYKRSTVPNKNTHCCKTTTTQKSPSGETTQQTSQTNSFSTGNGNEAETDLTPGYSDARTDTVTTKSKVGVEYSYTTPNGSVARLSSTNTRSTSATTVGQNPVTEETDLTNPSRSTDKTNSGTTSVSTRTTLFNQSSRNYNVISSYKLIYSITLSIFYVIS